MDFNGLNCESQPVMLEILKRSSPDVNGTKLKESELSTGSERSGRQRRHMGKVWTPKMESLKGLVRLVHAKGAQNAPAENHSVCD